MKKCRNKNSNVIKCNECCYECIKKITCTSCNCYSKESKDFEYKDCFFFLDTDNIRIIKENIITCDD